MHRLYSYLHYEFGGREGCAHMPTVTDHPRGPGEKSTAGGRRGRCISTHDSPLVGKWRVKISLECRRHFTPCQQSLSNMDDDASLIRRALAGDELAIEAIVERHGPSLRGMALAILKNRAAADDAVQETFERTFLHLASVRRPESLKQFLRTVCNNACLDRLQHQDGKIVAIESLGLREPETDPDCIEERLDIARALDTLPLAEREAYVLVAVHGFTRERAAIILGVRASTLRDRVRRARERLVTALQDYRAEVPSTVDGQ
jgi:RNA polymerase sigma-70 factor, ECF subfamily